MSVKPRELKIVALCSYTMEPFFRILGIDEVFSVSSATDAKKLLEDLKTRGDVAVIVVEWSLVRDLPLEEVLRNPRMYPIVVVFPDLRSVKEFDVREFYRPLVRKYIGLEIHLPES